MTERKLTLIYGARRLNAFKKLGLKEIPTLINGKRLEIVPVKELHILGNTRTELGDLSSLMSDIEQNGLLQPIGAVDYEIEESDWLLKNLSENIQRKDITPDELFKGVKMLHEKKGFSLREIAVKLSLPLNKIKDVMHIGKTMPQEVIEKVGFWNNKKKVVVGTVPITTARGIWALRIKESEKKKLFNVVKKESWANDKLALLDNVLRTGLDFDSAVKNVDEFTSFTYRCAFKTKKMDKLLKDYKLKNKSDLVTNILKGNINQTDLRGLMK